MRSEIAGRDWPVELVVIADPKLLAERARALGVTLRIDPYRPESTPMPARAGRLLVQPVPLRAAVRAGRTDPANASYVLHTLRRATEGCLSREFAALVTAPVHKGVINDAGIPFRGHTEFLAELTSTPQPVMLLVADRLRVALLTTHLPLRAVPDSITATRLEDVLQVLHTALVREFGIDQPRIAVLGLNPHAG